MANDQVERVRRLAKDLRREEPRPAHEELAGFPLAARCVDKCRATLMGWQGNYIYGCAMDRQFLSEAGLDANDLRQFVATGASDEEISDWIHSHAHGQAR
jgi:hypothetical protein